MHNEKIHTENEDHISTKGIIYFLRYSILMHTANEMSNI